MNDEKPILFSGPMVRAILHGRKTMTRRVVKTLSIRFKNIDMVTAQSWPKGKSNEDSPDCNGLLNHPDLNALLALSPYGQPGDRLIVKENAWMWCERIPNGITKTGRKKWRHAPLQGAPIVYHATHNKPTIPIDHPITGNEWGWRLKVARFMPRWASRITLEVVSVRVERVQDISEADAKAEGVHSTGDYFCMAERQGGVYRHAKDAFRELWDSINAKRGYWWSQNPWVWVVEFRRTEG